MNPSVLLEKLRQWEPWGHRIDFSNGVSTAQCKHRVPFSENPLQKLATVEKAIPFNDLRHGKVLDIGCNSGYNSIHCATAYHMSPVGIDVSPRHIDVSQFLTTLAGVEAEYLLADAQTFSRPKTFDLVLHFETLYHLPNPLLSLHTTYENLKPGGYLALETQLYDHPEDENLCYFMNMHNNDITNYWALSTKVLIDCLRLAGFQDVQEVLRATPPLHP